MPPAAIASVTTSNGSQIDQSGRERAGDGDESQCEADAGGDDRDRAGTAVEGREHADRDDGGAERDERAVAGERDARRSASRL